MKAENSVLMLLGIIFRSLSSFSFRRTWESSGVMRDVKSTVTGTFKCTEDSGTSSGSLKTNIQNTFEWSSLALVFGDIISSTISLSDALVHGVHALLFEQSSGQKESGAVSSWVVSETSGKIEASELLGIGAAEGLVTHEGGVVDGANNSTVGDSHNKSVLFGIVFIVVHDS